MSRAKIQAGKVRASFRCEKGRESVRFRQVEGCLVEDKERSVIVDHDGHDTVHLEFREVVTDGGGERRDSTLLKWELDPRSAAELGSILILLAEKYMRNDAEEPFRFISDTEKAAFGTNWVREDLKTATARVERRRSRSYLVGLMTRCIETCDDQDFINFMLQNLVEWAQDAQDGFAIHQSACAIAQLGLMPKSDLH